MAEHSHHDFKGLLFVSEPCLSRWLTTVLNVDKDMDGTLVDSLIAVESAWAAFAVTYPHLRIQEILESQLDLDLFGLYRGISQRSPFAASHGVRTEENLRRFIPSLSEDQIIVCTHGLWGFLYSNVIHACRRRRSALRKRS